VFVCRVVREDGHDPGGRGDHVEGSGRLPARHPRHHQAHRLRLVGQGLRPPHVQRAAGGGGAVLRPPHVQRAAGGGGAVAGHRAGGARGPPRRGGGRGRPGPHVRLRHRRDGRVHAADHRARAQAQQAAGGRPALGPAALGQARLQDAGKGRTLLSFVKSQVASYICRLILLSRVIRKSQLL